VYSILVKVLGAFENLQRAIVRFVTTVRTEKSSLTGLSVKFILGTFNEDCPQYLRLVKGLQKLYMKYMDSKLWFQASTEVKKRLAFFRAFTQRRLVVSYLRSGTTYQSFFLNFLTLDDGYCAETSVTYYRRDIPEERKINVDNSLNSSLNENISDECCTNKQKISFISKKFLLNSPHFIGQLHKRKQSR
jgi:hypothetical protein